MRLRWPTGFCRSPRNSSIRGSIGLSHATVRRASACSNFLALSRGLPASTLAVDRKLPGERMRVRQSNGLPGRCSARCPS